MAAVENSKLSRRGFLASSAAVGAANVFPAAARAAIEDNAIHPFRANIPEEQLVDLRRRITATRWPDKETVADQSQGFSLRSSELRSGRCVSRIEKTRCGVRPASPANQRSSM
jgi:hypothetical protein